MAIEDANHEVERNAADAPFPRISTFLSPKLVSAGKGRKRSNQHHCCEWSTVFLGAAVSLDMINDFKKRLEAFHLQNFRAVRPELVIVRRYWAKNRTSRSQDQAVLSE